MEEGVGGRGFWAAAGLTFPRWGRARGLRHADPRQHGRATHSDPRHLCRGGASAPGPSAAAQKERRDVLPVAASAQVCARSRRRVVADGVARASLYWEQRRLNWLASGPPAVVTAIGWGVPSRPCRDRVLTGVYQYGRTRRPAKVGRVACRASPPNPDRGAPLGAGAASLEARVGRPTQTPGLLEVDTQDHTLRTGAAAPFQRVLLSRSSRDHSTSIEAASRGQAAVLLCSQDSDAW